eukprot:347878-Chlamydomonas_euryale.AAC.2
MQRTESTQAAQGKHTRSTQEAHAEVQAVICVRIVACVATPVSRPYGRQRLATSQVWPTPASNTPKALRTSEGVEKGSHGMPTAECCPEVSAG